MPVLHHKAKIYIVDLCSSIVMYTVVIIPWKLLTSLLLHCYVLLYQALQDQSATVPVAVHTPII